MTDRFQNITAWQKAHDFVLLVYKKTKDFPSFERFGLCSQFQRAAVSIPANIAEGYKKIGKSDKLRFYNIAQGSLEECRYYILLSKDLHYINEEDYTLMNLLVEDVSRLLNAYCKGVIDNNYVDSVE